MPAPVTSLITEHVSRGGRAIRDGRPLSKIWMGTRCFWCPLLTGPAADRHLPSRNLFCQFNVTSAYNHASEHRQSISRADLRKKSCAFRCLLSFILDATRDRDRSTTSSPFPQNIFNWGKIWISGRRLRWTSNASIDGFDKIWGLNFPQIGLNLH